MNVGLILAISGIFVWSYLDIDGDRWSGFVQRYVNKTTRFIREL